jgi:ApaG protein
MAHPEFTCTVSVAYLPEQSQPQADVHAFAYTVTIVNSGDVTAQLVARQWLVADANGHTEEVRGLAVVGHQPLLKPNPSNTPAGHAWPRHTRCKTFFCMTEDACLRCAGAAVHVGTNQPALMRQRRSPAPGTCLPRAERRRWTVWPAERHLWLARLMEWLPRAAPADAAAAPPLRCCGCAC